jgi:tripeptidyl-peptidase-1
MTPEEVIEFFSPAQTTVDVVKEWLVSSGIPAERIGHSVNKQVSISCPLLVCGMFWTSL